MSDLSYSAMLRELSKDYYQNHLGFEEYRSQRKTILIKIDEEFNGHKVLADDSLNIDSSDESQEKDSSILMKTIAFFKNSDTDD